ncbi:hypothetical protein [Brevundimonas sp.]|uniref:hypothetical protein n=1 Tax=Brevundimonas sp. TaxID=1871086 RepID=UPI003F7225B2
MAVLILAAAPAAAAAATPEIFIAPTGALTHGAPVLLRIGSGDFPTQDHGVRPGQVAQVRARAAGTRLAATLPANPASPTVTLEWPETIRPHQNGVVAAVDLGPALIEIEANQIDAWLNEIGAAPDVAATVRAVVAREGRLSVTETRHLKLMSCVAACDGLAPERPSSSRLEFVASDEAWRLLEDGQPRIAHAVFVTTAAQGRRRLTTDRHGRVLLPADTTGPVLLSAVVLIPPTTPDGRFNSERAVLTIDASVR